MHFDRKRSNGVSNSSLFDLLVQPFSRAILIYSSRQFYTSVLSVRIYFIRQSYTSVLSIQIYFIRQSYTSVLSIPIYFTWQFYTFVLSILIYFSGQYYISVLSISIYFSGQSTSSILPAFQFIISGYQSVLSMYNLCWASPFLISPFCPCPVVQG